MDKFKQLENVNIGEVCRACFETCEQYKMLFEIGENSEKRSWGDVFFDVVKIEAPTSPESSPCRICLPCCNDLLSAFTFIQKSKENNDRLLEFLKTANIKQSDCLSEFPIDIPKESNTSDYLHIKVEDESINEYCYTDDKHSAQSSSESEGSDDEPLFHKQGKHKKMQCTYCNRIFKRWDFFENHMKRHEEDTKQKDGSAGEALKTIMCDECEFTCNTRQELKLHQISTHTSRVMSSERESSNSSAEQINSVDKSDDAFFRVQKHQRIGIPSQPDSSKENPDVLMLKLEINNLKETCMKEFKEIKELIIQQNMVKTSFENSKPVIEKLRQKTETDMPDMTIFPINSDEQLHSLNNVNDEQHKLLIIATIKQIISNGGLALNMNKVFGSHVIISYNYEGKRGKKSLKELTNVNEILYRAAYIYDGYSMLDYENDLRKGFRIMKNRYFKKKSVQRKNESLKSIK